MSGTAQKHVVLGVTGGIAAYKACDLASKLTQRGVQVHVIMTEHAARFVCPATFRELTGQPVVVDMFAENPGLPIAHIALARMADLLLIAPATANVIGKMAAGIADDALTTTALAVEAPVLLAPAMNTKMWEKPVLQENLAKLRQRGVLIVGPAEGVLACGEVGAGRLAPVEEILAAALHLLGLEEGAARKAGTGTAGTASVPPTAGEASLAGWRVLVTAGPTQEPLDPVRFLSNRSSGKMGYAIAAAASARGAQVTLVSGPVALQPPAGVEVVAVQTAQEMADAVARRLDSCDVFVAAAAVADFRPATVQPEKIKKQEGTETLELRLVRTPDILAMAGERRRQRGGQGGPILVGFAAETGSRNLIDLARDKLQRKGVDLVVANDVTAAGSGFGTDTNQVHLVWAGGQVESWPLLRKDEVARRLWNRLSQFRQGRS